MSKPQEIELKLLVPGLSANEALQRLRRAPSLRRRKSNQTRLRNRYFDTPDLALQRERSALRLRQVGDAHDSPWIQTFKTAGTSQGGLSQRGEWEQPVARGELDAHALAQTPWRELDPDGSRFSSLRPCFDTECLRTTWQVRLRDGTQIEVALDAGAIRAGDRAETLLELELELQSGKPQALFALAQELAQHLPLLPSDVSKAQRGYALASGAVASATQAHPVSLPKHAAPGELALPVLAEILGQFHRNLEGLLHHDAPELVHQARVAWRRWRSVTRLLRPWLPALPGAAALHPLLQSLGRLRDIDVALHDTLPRWATAYLADEINAPPLPQQRETDWKQALQALAHLADQERQAVRRALATPSVTAHLITLTTWLHALNAPIPSEGQAPIGKGWAKRRLDRWHQRLERLLEDAHAHPDRLHEARLMAKRLRYSSEAIAGTLPDQDARRLRRWARQASQWQANIGQRRDLAQAARLLETVQAAPELVGFMRGVSVALAQQAVAP